MLYPNLPAKHPGTLLRRGRCGLLESQKRPVIWRAHSDFGVTLWLTDRLSLVGLASCLIFSFPFSLSPSFPHITFPNPATQFGLQLFQVQILEILWVLEVEKEGPEPLIDFSQHSCRSQSPIFTLVNEQRHGGQVARWRCEY